MFARTSRIWAQPSAELVEAAVLRGRTLDLIYFDSIVSGCSTPFSAESRVDANGGFNAVLPTVLPN
jgi:hypothetical protein